MNIVSHIINYLQFRDKELVLPHFGYFSVQMARAKYDEKSKSFLPPSYTIGFNQDFNVQGTAFLHYLVDQEKLTYKEAERLVATQVALWKYEISDKRELVVESLGRFVKDGEALTFDGERMVGDTPDFFGLEEIPLNQLKKRSKGGGYKFFKILFWLVFVAALLGLSVWAYLYPDQVFGQASVLEVLENTPPVSETIVQPSEAKNSALADTLVTDTLKLHQLKSN